MEKDCFVEKYLKSSRITIWFEEKVFMNDSNITINEDKRSVSQFKDYFCPWHYRGAEFISAIEQATQDTNVQSMQISSSILINSILPADRLEKINLYQQNIPQSLWNIPIAVDLLTNKTLILDSNKTCVALYRKYLSTNRNVQIPVIEVRGKSLDNLIEDFKVLNRQ